MEMMSEEYGGGYYEENYEEEWEGSGSGYEVDYEEEAYNYQLQEKQRQSILKRGSTLTVTMVKEGGVEEEEEEEYPDMLQFCEAHLDLDHDDDGDGDDDDEGGEGSSRTWCSNPIQDMEGYGSNGRSSSSSSSSQNKQFTKQKKIPTQELFKKLKADDSNILARKLMGVPSQSVQKPPPPLLQKPKASSTTISLESILRQQKSSNSLPPRLQPKNALVVGNQLKIKANHIPREPPLKKTNGFSNLKMKDKSSLLSSSARTNGAASLLNSNRGIAARVLQVQKPKNVPRCPICKRTFATNQVLQRHMTLHVTLEEPTTEQYKCEECFETFPNFSQLTQHMQSHEIEPSSVSMVVHRCRVCYRTFTCVDSLKAHSLMHDGEFKCRACRRGFTDWATLEEHEATHKRYNCQWCEKYFMNSGNLKAHERIHTGERPYRCSDCPKAFKQLGGLQYHLKTNPSHRPQKYHKNEFGESNQFYEDYEDGAVNLSLTGAN